MTETPQNPASEHTAPEQSAPQHTPAALPALSQSQLPAPQWNMPDQTAAANLGAGPVAGGGSGGGAGGGGGWGGWGGMEQAYPAAHGGYPPPPGQPPTGYPGAIPGAAGPQKGKFKVGIATLALFTLFAAGIGGVAGAYVNHTNASSSSVTAITGSNSSDTASAVGAVAKKNLPSVVQVNETTSSVTGVGSGMVISADGLILTNNHVIADYVSEGGTLTVTTYDGHTYNAKVIGYITADDIAVIQAEGVSGWTPVTFADSSQVQVGDSVVAIGSPDDLQNTVTSGIVSALNRQVSVTESTNNGNGFPGFGWNGLGDSTTVTYNAIQTDASINPGNSGGPLLNLQGQVVGMDSSIYSSSSTSTSSSAGSVGLGFAIPANQLQKDIKTIEAGGGDSATNGNSN